MVKREAPSTDSDGDLPRTPLAASTQKTPPKKQIKHHSSSDSGSSSSEDEGDTSPKPEDLAASESLTGLSSHTLKTSKEKYLAKFPFVRPCKAKYCVDVDLTDSSDEVWIVKCPTSVDARKVLMGAKMEAMGAGSVSKITSPHETGTPQLEGVVMKNTTQKPVTIMAGADFKSFVPVGTIQIRETLEDAVPVLPEKTVLTVEEEIPFPEVIRDRHPLLGVNYQLAQKLPKHVKKALSLAQQRSDACYLQKGEDELATAVPSMESLGSHRSSKRKRGGEDMLDYVDSAEAVNSITMMIKEEVQSPSPRKKKMKVESPTKAAAAAGAPPAEEDLSWLNEM